MSIRSFYAYVAVIIGFVWFVIKNGSIVGESMEGLKDLQVIKNSF